MQIIPSEAEVVQLLKEAARQYEETLRVADAVHDVEDPNKYYPEYSWNNPIGLVLTEQTNADLV